MDPRNDNGPDTAAVAGLETLIAAREAVANPTAAMTAVAFFIKIPSMRRTPGRRIALGRDRRDASPTDRPCQAGTPTRYLPDREAVQMPKHASVRSLRDLIVSSFVQVPPTRLWGALQVQLP